MIKKLPYVSTEKEIAFDDFCTLVKVESDLSESIICKGRLCITNISLKIADQEILFDTIKRAELTFDGDLAFSTVKSKGSHYEIRNENGYAAGMYLEIYRRFKRDKT